MCRLDIYSEASLLRALYMNRPLLYSLFSLQKQNKKVVTVVSEKIKFTAFLSREFNLFLRTSLHTPHTTDA